MNRATLDNIQSEMGCLSELLKTTQDVVSDMDFGAGTERNTKLDQVAALVRIAERLSSEIVDLMDRVPADERTQS